ncbi:MAG: hypothetical protein JSW60_04770 [Thermoplasmatales archaeon]|nr:MAG: hypothetical protein JSW60_04770 [Thermoplasmatales archaeon]
MKKVENVFYYLILSTAAAFLLLVLAFFSSSNINTIGTHDRLFVGGVFVASCIFGISLAIYPGWLRRSLKIGSRSENKRKPQKTMRKGHHPDCDQFQNHIIRIGNKTLCAGCFGLSMGSIISIFLMIIYVIITSGWPPVMFRFLLLIGLIMIGFVYVEIMFPMRNTIVHVLSNVFLVISFLIIAIGIFEITGSKIYGTVGILLSFLWLDTRVQLSRWCHTLICSNCNETCKMY